MHCFGQSDIRISREKIFRNDFVPDRDRVPRQKPIARVIVSRAELAAPGNNLKLARFRQETKVMTAERNALRGSGTAQFSVASAVRAIDPAIQAPKQPVHS